MSVYDGMTSEEILAEQRARKASRRDRQEHAEGDATQRTVARIQALERLNTAVREFLKADLRGDQPTQRHEAYSAMITAVDEIADLSR